MHQSVKTLTVVLKVGFVSNAIIYRSCAVRDMADLQK
jgi:hypothetical protein